MVNSVSVSNLGTNYYNDLIIKNLNLQLQNVNQQISTGQKSQTYGGLGTQAGQSLTLNSQNTVLNGYINAINATTPQTDNMDTAMTNISSAVSNVVSSLDQISQGGTPNLTNVTTAAQNALSQIQQLLNSQVGGTFIFGGDLSNTAPLADTSAVNTNVGAQVNSYGTGPSAATIISNISNLTDAQLGYNTNLAAAGNVSVRADNNLNIDYTVKADEPQFKNIMAGLSEIANLTYNSSDASDFWSLFNDAKSRLSTASTTVSQRQGELGVARNQMASLLTAHNNAQLALQTNIGTVDDVDIASASATLSSLETQVQATYESISQTSKLSLVNYLTTT